MSKVYCLDENCVERQTKGYAICTINNPEDCPKRKAELQKKAEESKAE